MSNDERHRPRGGGPDTPAPARRPEFAQLTLKELRAYRRTLTNEEHRVSYWRRIVHARIDLVREVDAGSSPSVAELRNLFGETRPANRRAALLQVSDGTDLPPLPDLLRVWAREPRPGDPEHNADLEDELGRIERQLSDYRNALHIRIESATGELIARYHEQPDLCLSALPTQRPEERVRTG